MTEYDFCIAWNWEHDRDFVLLLEAACRTQGLSFLQVTPENLAEVVGALERNELGFRVFLDRASESDSRFLPIVERAAGKAADFINPHEKAVRSLDKAFMHYELINSGLHTPYTIIIPPFHKQPYLQPLDLSPLGGRFIIKPSHGGGGEGVVIEARTMEQVLSARRESPGDTYLLQAHITPTRLGERSAWFRIIFCTDKVYPFWWEIGSPVYLPVSEEEERLYDLGGLRQQTGVIARICRLELFSTEIARTPDGRFVVVDYVNDQIDLRLKSKTYDGVPDEVVQDIASRLAFLALKR